MKRPFAVCDKLLVMFNFSSPLKRAQMKCRCAFGLAVLGIQSFVAAAATPECQPITELAEKQIAGSLIAFNGKVLEVERDPDPAPAVAPPAMPGVFTQVLTFQVLNSWKGSHQAGATVHLTVRVTESCAGKACVFPFKIGDTALVLSPASWPYSAPAFFDGCWVHQGVDGRSILIMTSIAPNY
jgi:hypothetical protein